METIKIIPPQWKRKHSIILKAIFNTNQTKKEKEELDNIIAMTLWRMWLFDDNSNNGREWK